MSRDELRVTQDESNLTCRYTYMKCNHRTEQRVQGSHLSNCEFRSQCLQLFAHLNVLDRQLDSQETLFSFIN